MSWYGSRGCRGCNRLYGAALRGVCGGLIIAKRVGSAFRGIEKPRPCDRGISSQDFRNAGPSGDLGAATATARRERPEPLPVVLINRRHSDQLGARLLHQLLLQLGRQAQAAFEAVRSLWVSVRPSCCFVFHTLVSVTASARYRGLRVFVASLRERRWPFSWRPVPSKGGRCANTLKPHQTRQQESLTFFKACIRITVLQL